MRSLHRHRTIVPPIPNIFNVGDIPSQVMAEEEFITTSISGFGVNGIELEVEFFSLLDDCLSRCSEFFKRVEFEVGTRFNSMVKK